MTISLETLSAYVNDPFTYAEMYTPDVLKGALEDLFPDETARAGVRDHLARISDRESIRVALAVLVLAQGDPARVPALVDAAARDYRDVLYWIHLDREDARRKQDKKRRAP